MSWPWDSHPLQYEIVRNSPYKGYPSQLKSARHYPLLLLQWSANLRALTFCIVIEASNLPFRVRSHRAIMNNSEQNYSAYFMWSLCWGPNDSLVCGHTVRLAGSDVVRYCDLGECLKLFAWGESIKTSLETS